MPLQLPAPACNLANFLRTLALPEEVQHWSLTSIRDKLVKIGPKLVSHARYATLQMDEVAVPRDRSAISLPTLPICDVERPSHSDRKL